MCFTFLPIKDIFLDQGNNRVAGLCVRRSMDGLMGRACRLVREGVREKSVR